MGIFTKPLLAGLLACPMLVLGACSSDDSSTGGGTGGAPDSDAGHDSSTGSGGSNSGSGGSSSSTGGSSSSGGAPADGGDTSPSWVGEGSCAANPIKAGCSEFPDKPNQYRCVLGVMPNVAPEPDCVHPTKGTLPGAAWCCPHPLCTRTSTTDYSCSGATPHSYSCPTADLVPGDCVAIGSQGGYCCP